MDCSTSDDDNNDYYANCMDTMSINHFSSYRSCPTYMYSNVVKQNLLKEQCRLEKIQKEKELLEKFANMALAKKVSFQN